MAFSLVLLLSSCGDDEPGVDGAIQNKDGTISYDAFGLRFRLPDYFRKKTVPYYELCYSTPGATFRVDLIYREDVEDETLEYDFEFDLTVKEFCEYLIDYNNFECEYTYDETRDVGNFYFFYSEDDVEYDYIYVTILKTEYAIYVVEMFCAEADYENYEPLFRLWASYISAY